MQIQNILRAIRKADQDFDLIEDGDKIAVALSGGKDSMLLFAALGQYQKFKGKNFELVGIHVDVGFENTDLKMMEDFAREHGLNLIIEKTRIYEILQLPKSLSNAGKIQCSLCSKLKKGVLFEKAKEMGCKSIAFGHHADDAVETLLMNMVHGSKIATFQPKQYMSRMDMYTIRPMVYLKESEIIGATQTNNIASARRVCPNDGFTERESMKQLLNRFYQDYPQAHDNFITSLSNLDQLSLWNKRAGSKKDA